MKIAASSCCWWHHTLEEGIRLAGAAGFTAYEPLVFPEEIFPLHGDLRRIACSHLMRLLADNGMELAALHIAAIPTTPPGRYRACVEYTKLAIERAAETGCNLVVVGGPQRAEEPFFPFLKALEEIEPLLHGSPVRIALENHYGNWIQFIEDYEHIFDYIKSPNVGITLDTGHFTAAGVDPAEVARRLRDKVFHVHIKDHVGGKSVPLGTGQTNNIGAVRVLRESGYQGYLSQEIECGQGEAADKAAAEGFAYMTGLLNA
jgi:sugar phosphate isomerase/epimerase